MGSVSVDDSEMQLTSYQYDENGNLIKTTFDDNTTVEMTYDELGRKISETNQEGLTRTFTYDTRGNLATVTMPPPEPGDPAPVYLYQYDERGNQILLVDPLGRETRFTYDEQGRQLTRTLPLGFGDDGIEGTADDPASPDEWTEQFVYDAFGRHSLIISFEGRVAEFIYDAASGRLDEQNYYDSVAQYDNGNGTPSETVNYTTDAFGRILTIDQPNRTATNTYDEMGNLVRSVSQEGILEYDYDDFGRKIALSIFAATANPDVDPPERVTVYTYDALGRLQTLTEDPDVGQTGDELNTTYYYDLVGNLDLTLLPNNIAEDYVYDDLNRLDLVAHYTTNGTQADLDDLSDNDQVALFDYTVRNDGMRTALSETFYDNSGFVLVSNDYTWNYDDLGRLVKEIIDSSDNARDVTIDYDYDAVGNRLSKTVDNLSDSTTDESITSTYDANDRLLTEDKDTDGVAGAEETTTYGYNGTEQTSEVETRADGSTVTTTNTFNLQGRMASVSIKTRDASSNLLSETLSTYEYDTNGQRVRIIQETDSDGNGSFETKKRIESLADHHNFTGYAQTIRETEYDVDTGNITKVTDYTFGHDEVSQTVTEYDEFGTPGTPVTHVFGHDGHGSVRVLFDAMAAAVQLFVYDAYGVMHAVYDGTGTFVGADAKDALTNLLYSGEKTDAVTGLQYLRARYYNPNTGRFNRLDPFFGNPQDPQSFHKYLYTHANPINAVDPTGLFSVAGMLSASSISSTIQSMHNEVLMNAAGAGVAAHFAGQSGKNGFVAFDEAFKEGMRDSFISMIPYIGTLYDIAQLASFVFEILAAYFGFEIFEQIANTAGAVENEILDGVTGSGSPPAAQSFSLNSATPSGSSLPNGSSLIPNTDSHIRRIAAKIADTTNKVLEHIRWRNVNATYGRISAKHAHPRAKPPKRLNTWRESKRDGLGQYDYFPGHPTPAQNNHINQKAAFRQFGISDEDGFVIPMIGGTARKYAGTPHYEFHYTLEGFWDLYRKNGLLEGEYPTLEQYDAIVRQALQDAGYPSSEAHELADLAKSQWVEKGLDPETPFLEIPTTRAVGKHELGLFEEI